MDVSYGPPYFTRLFDRLSKDDAQISTAFGRHVHWGYFEDPEQSAVSASEYGQAAEVMCLKMLELADIRERDIVLDVGCGFGGTVACLNERYSPLEIIGLNIDIKQLAHAANSVVPRPDNLVQFVAATASRLPAADSAIDTALCVESVFHFDRLSFFAEISRVLRPGGSLTLSDFVPAERAARFIADMDFGDNAAIRSAYGAIDISWPLSRYEELAAEHRLAVGRTVDVSPHTLPTYAFLRNCIEKWEDRSEAEKFQRATNLLEQATRRGFITYQLIRFEKSWDS